MQAATRISKRTATGRSGASVAVLAFNGDIASTSKDAILDAYRGLDGGTARILLDFSHAEYINSSGIAVIIQLLLEASKGGKHTVGIFGLSPHFNKVFTMVGVAKYATLSPNEATALSGL